MLKIPPANMSDSHSTSPGESSSESPLIGMMNPLQILKGLEGHPDYRTMADPDYFSTEIAGIHSPLMLPDMEKAVAYLKEAVFEKKHILVFGDRDVDGVSSTALLGSFLGHVHERNGEGELTLRVSDDGDDYGLTGGVFQDILNSGADLVILLDMGTSNGPEIDALIEKGKRVIVLDHHQVHMRVPDNEHCAFVNPMRLEDRLEHEGKIATVGLVFKLLLGYALSFTKDWRTSYYMVPPTSRDESAAASNGSPPPNGDATGPGYLYRLGRFLGEFSTPDAAQAWLDDNPDFELAGDDGDDTWFHIVGKDHHLFRLTEREWERLVRDPKGAGKVLLSFQMRARPRLAEFVREISDIAAVGLITDMVPLVGENRAIIKIGTGLAGYQGRRGVRAYRPGYDALLGALTLPRDCILSRDLGWSIGPALNAAGRMGNTALALRLLVSRDEAEAKKLAKELVKLNQERKERTKRNEAVVAAYLEEKAERTTGPIIFCFHEDLEPGVSGIMATRLTEKYQRPAVFINPDGKLGKGSARTFNGMNMLELLDRTSDIFVQFGGHVEAAGFSVQFDDIPRLEQALMQAAEQMLAEKDGSADEVPDAPPHHLELTPNSLNRRLFDELLWLEPFGEGNPEPVLKVSGVTLRNHKYMTEGKHVRFNVSGASDSMEFVAWGQGAKVKDFPPEAELDLYGCLEQNYFRGRKMLRFRVEEFRIRS